MKSFEITGGGVRIETLLPGVNGFWQLYPGRETKDLDGGGGSPFKEGSSLGRINTYKSTPLCN